jgi:hypothetical protein
MSNNQNQINDENRYNELLNIWSNIYDMTHNKAGSAVYKKIKQKTGGSHSEVMHQLAKFKDIYIDKMATFSFKKKGGQ